MYKKGISNTLIFIVITLFLIGVAGYFVVIQNKKIQPSSQPREYFCESDTDCVPYGSCSVDCVSRSWADSYPDIGPFCGLLLPEFECKCEDNKCSAQITDSRFISE